MTSPLSGAVVVHSGGPTAVLNASLAGVVDAAPPHTTLYGAIRGVEGLIHNNLVDLRPLQTARDTPGSILGSSRHRLTDADYDAVLANLRARGLHTIFFTGGNGSMAAALALSRAARLRNVDLQLIGIPKTIDNDLSVTHHSPGFASTANFFLHAARDTGLDNKSLPTPVCILETLGRNVGWVTAATALARPHPDDRDEAPHLIYLPERPLSLERIAADVEAVYRRLGRCVLAVCEGQLDETGQPFGAHTDRGLASNLGHTLGRRLTALLGVRTRCDKPGHVGRSPSTLASPRDRRDSFECGRAAVAAALAGEHDVMVALNADGTTFLTPLETVAGLERGLPAEYIAPAGNDVTAAFLDYLRPLI